MTDRQPGALCAFVALVAFRADEFIYAAERYALLACDDYDAERRARDRAADSVYVDDRVPGFALEVAVESLRLDAAGDGSAFPTAMAVSPLCASCGSDDIVHEAVARWDVAAQDWALSSTFDDAICGACEREGDNILTWLPFDPRPLCLGSRVKVTSWDERYAGSKGIVIRFEEVGVHIRLDPASGKTHHEVAWIANGHLHGELT